MAEAKPDSIVYPRYAFIFFQQVAVKMLRRNFTNTQTDVLRPIGLYKTNDAYRSRFRTESMSFDRFWNFTRQ